MNDSHSIIGRDNTVVQTFCLILKFDFLFLFYFLNSQFRSKLVKTISTSVTFFSHFRSISNLPWYLPTFLGIFQPILYDFSKNLHYVPNLLIFISQSKTFTIFSKPSLISFTSFLNHSVVFSLPFISYLPFFSFL